MMQTNNNQNPTQGSIPENSSQDRNLGVPAGYSLSVEDPFGNRSDFRIPVHQIIREEIDRPNWVPICSNDFHLNSEDYCEECESERIKNFEIFRSQNLIDQHLNLCTDSKDCDHFSCFSTSTSCRFCPFCLFIFNLDKFYKRNLYLISRQALVRLFHGSAEELLSRAIFFTYNICIDAEVVANNRIGCEYVKLFHPDLRPSITSPPYASDWVMCDNAKHLFECLGLGDTTRGHLYGLISENAYWNATCSKCGACCQGANARTAIPIVMALQYCKVDVYYSEYYLYHIYAPEERMKIDKQTAHLLHSIIRGAPAVDCSELSQEPIHRMVMDSSKLVALDSTIRHPKSQGSLLDSECDHEFILRTSHGIKIPMSKSLFISFLTMGAYHGYAHDDQQEQNAIISFGGMPGVNLACNKNFLRMHKSFYSGSFRRRPLFMSQIPSTNATAQSGFNDEEFERLMAEEGVHVKVERPIAERFDYEDVIDIYDETDHDRTRALGLGQVFGGLLKGISHCVDSLHKVFDFPLDLAIEAAQKTGDWLEGNKAAVDETKICVGCPEIQKDMISFQNETKEAFELIRSSIKKLSEGIDKITKMNATNFERILDRIKPIESRLTELENKAPASDSKAMEALVQAVKDLKIMKEAMLDLNRRLSKLEGKKSDGQTAEGTAGEQQPIPKTPTRVKARPVVKQSGTIMVNEESTETFRDNESRVTDPNRSDMFAAVTAEYLVKSFTWKVSDGQDKVLADLDLPQDLWKSNSRLSDIMGYFQYYDATGITFRITTTCVPMHGGTLCAAWDANGCATRQGIATTVQLTGLPKTFIEAHSSSETIIVVKNSNIQSAICLSGSEHSFGRMGILKICCLNTLNAPKEATQQVAVNVWIKFDGVKFHVYSLRKNPVVSQLQVASLTDIGELSSVVATGSWSTTSATNLMELNIHPTSCAIQNGLITQTPLSVLAHAFARWRGSLKISIIFGASLFTRGRILAAAVPVAKRKGTMSLDEISGYHNVCCLLNGQQTTFELEIPYYSVGQDSFVYRDALFDISAHDGNFMITRLHLVILDKLVMSANASSSINFSVTLGPGSDLELKYLAGVHGQRIVRELKMQVSLGRSFENGVLIGSGFDDLLQRWSHLVSMPFNAKGDSDEIQVFGYIMTVAPAYRSLPVHCTLLSWFSQLFVQWKGGIKYRLHIDSEERRWGGFIKVWHDPNGSLDEGKEFAKADILSPPAGAMVRYWNYLNGDLEFTVPFCARTSTLFIPKAMIATDSKSWILNYNGTLNFAYQGVDDFTITVETSAADDFEFHVRTVAPRAGKVNEAFAKLEYASDLKDIKESLTSSTRLKGPHYKTKITSIEPNKIDENESSRGKDNKSNLKFEDLLNATAQMDFDRATANVGCVPFSIAKTAKVLSERETCKKMADVLDFTHSCLNLDSQPAAARLAAAISQIAPIMESIGRTTQSVEEKLASVDTFRDKIMALISNVLGDTLPGLAIADFKKGKYVWASFLTMIAACVVAWAATSKKSFLKRFAVVAMIIWSPFLASKIWALGTWIRKSWSKLWPKSDSCRQHSLAGLCESVFTSFKDFPDWFKSGGITIVTQVCTVLLTIVSLITLGTIPSTKQNATFADKFKEFGNMSRATTSIAAGYKTISELCSKFTNYLAVTFFGAQVDDDAFKGLVAFNVKEWILEVKNLSLEENKFSGFGGDERLVKVRHLYDKSVEITYKLLQKNRVPIAMLPIIRDTCKKCEDLLNESYTYKGMKTPRVDPFYICLFGAPGVGKSTVASMIVDDLLDAMGEPKVDRIYTRCCSDQYWSNYHHEPVICYDDLGAISRPASLSDYGEIMGIKSNRPYSLPMAAVDEKGRHCLSRYLIACTNLTHLDDTGDVKTKDAYYRRINVPVTVTREVTAMMNPEDPTDGLRFTVDQVLDGGRWINVTESRLLNGRMPFRAEDLMNMNYSYFMEFLKMYAALYMENQNMLVAKLRGTEIPELRSSENEELEFDYLATAQMDHTVTFGELVTKFNSYKLTGKQWNKRLCELGWTSLDGWNTNKIMRFDDLVAGFCGCSRNENCNFDFYHQRLQACLNKKGFAPAYQYFNLHKLNSDTQKTELKLKCGTTAEDLFRQADLMVIFSYLLFVARIGVSGSHVCLSYNMLNVKDVKDFEICRENVLDLSRKTTIDGEECYIWNFISDIFPRIVAKYNCVVLNDGEKRYIFVTDSAPTRIFPDLAWSDLISGKQVVSPNIIKVAGETKSKTIAPLLADSYKAFKDPKAWLERNKELKAALEIEEYIALLFAVACEAGRFTQILDKPPSRRKILNMSERYNAYIEQEKGLIGRLSKPAKICLAIGTGVAIFGALAGIGVGLFKLIAHFNKDEEEVDEIEFDILSPEMSGSHESGQHTTRYVTKERVPSKPARRQHEFDLMFDNLPTPQVEELKSEMTCASASDEHKTQYVKRRVGPVSKRKDASVAEISGAHASDQHHTEYLKARVPLMKRIATKESYVVTYDDEPSSHISLARRIRRTRLARAIKQMAVLEDFPSTLEEIRLWRQNAANKGVIVPKYSTSGKFFSGLLDDEEEEPQNVNMLNEEDIEVDKRMFEKISEVISVIQPRKNELERMIEEGVHHKVVKQARVNDKGLAKDPNMVTILTDKLINISAVIVNLTPTRRAYMNVVRLIGTIVVCPAHYLEALEEGDELYFICFSLVIKLTFDPSRVTLVNSQQDLMVWDLGNMVPPSIDTLKMIPTLEDWDHFQDGPGAFAVTKYNSKFPTNYINTLTMIERIRANTQNPTGCYSMMGSQHTITTGLRYQMFSLDGFCGGLILRASTNMVRKVVGIHVAGSQNHAMGYAECLIAEDLRAAVARLALDPRSTIQASLKGRIDAVSKQCGLDRALGTIGCHGKVASEDITSAATKTSIRKSRIHGLVGEIRTEPSILHAHDPRLPKDKIGKWDPVIEASMKYGSRITPFPVDQILEVEDHLSKMLANCENSKNKRQVNNLEIGINGIDQSDYWQQIEMDTSSGWPYAKRKPVGAAGKKWLFEQDGTYPSGKPRYVFGDAGLIESYNSMLGEAKQGISPTVITIECAKDERRKLNKIYEKPATRTFTILPPEINILFRQYFGDFAAMVMTCRAKLFCQVGINPESMEWGDLMLGLKEKSTKGFAGDYSKFDGIGDPQIYHSITQVVNNWYNDGEENATIRHALISSIIHRRGIVKEYLFQYCQGMPSGFAMTVIFNSFMNYYYLSLAWMNLISASPLSPQASLRYFDEYCKVIVYGDDNIVAVNEEFLEYYNLRLVAGYLSQFGVSYTDDAKNPIEKSERYVKIEDVTFLKRRWVSLGGRASMLYKAPLDKVSIEERLNWIRECDDGELALVQNIESALYEASIHGHTYFGELKDKIAKACDAVMITMPNIRYIDCQRRWWTSMTGGYLEPSDVTKLVRLVEKGLLDPKSVWKDPLYRTNKLLFDLLREVKAAPLAAFVV
uniref:Genome polyprotein n=1 Tax=Maize chlorotic dwarf virus TaxID=51354 RepID=Q6EEL1_9SECO|nr:polyprotein [Maize chlorotic dwarf virus]